MKTFSMTSCVVVAGVAAAAVSAGCSQATSQDDESVADVEDNGLEISQIVYHVNADGTWSANALQPVEGTGGYAGKATFTGPAGKTRKMGVCRLKLFRNASGVGTQCTDVSQCGSSPTNLPSGGYRYCTSINNTTPYYCYFRQGPETTYCAGTPANGYVAIAPGTYTTPYTSAQGIHISYACFEGCKGEAQYPSSSSAQANIKNNCQKC